MADRAFWDERFANDEPLESRDPNEFLVAVASKLQPGLALDAGCGPGNNAVWLVQKGWHVTAIDFSEVALRRAGELAGASGVAVRLVHGDLREINVEMGQYDLVVAAYLHFPRDERQILFRKLALAVRPGGTFFLIGHDQSNLEAGTGGPKDPSILYDPAELVEELAELPLDIVRAEQVQRTFLDGNGEAVAIDALVVAKPASHD